MEANTSITELKGTDRYTDEDGFVRKKRSTLAILLWLGVGAANIGFSYLPSDYDLLVVLSLPISAYLFLIAIQWGSSHDIDTWKGTSHVKLWIYLGNIIAGLLGLIIYEFLKGREKKYLHKTNTVSGIGPTKGKTT